MTLACIIDVASTALSSDEKAYFKDAQPWAFILFGRSCVSPEQIKALTSEIRESVGRDCLIFLDQEGGRVQRLKPPIWPQWSPIQIYGKLFEIDPTKAKRAVWLHHRLIAHEMKKLGIDADCAPCLDLAIEGAHSVIGDRSFSSYPDTISILGQSAIDGLHDGAVASVIKHIPGHGRAKADSHHELPIVTQSLEELALDFAPFKALSHAPMAMTAHVKYPVLDKEYCATLSKTIIQNLIRKEFGFDGLLMTDDVSMKALGGTNEEKIKGSIGAGCDVAMLCNASLDERISFANACPELDEAGLRRAKSAEKIANAQYQAIDSNSLWEELNSLIAIANDGQIKITADPTERH